MAYRVVRENNRSAGNPVAAGSDIIAGAPVMLNASGEVLPADGSVRAYGIACESTGFLPIAPLSGPTAGTGYDYTNFNRGGLVAAFITGSELELFDDGHGLPFDNTVTYAVNGEVYADATGKISSATSGDVIGYVVDFDAATGTKRLRVKFVL